MSSSKPVWASKTIWVNLIVVAVGIWAPKLNDEARTTIITAGAMNLALRFGTKKGIGKKNVRSN